MKVLWKYLLWFLSFSTLVIYYLFYTSLGNDTMSYFLGNYLSKKTGSKIAVEALKLDNYPIVSMKLKVNDGAEVFLKGSASRNNIDMNYHLVGDSFRHNSFFLKEPMDINGTLSGTVSELLVTGKGDVFEGKTQFNFIKTPKFFKNIDINLKGVNSQKVLAFLGKKPMVTGKADIDAYFKHYEAHQKDGKVLIFMNEGTIPSVIGDVSLSLKTEIIFANIEYFYHAGIKSKIGTCIISDGYYHKRRKEAKAKYILDLKDLAYFKIFFKHTYNGKFRSTGTINYSQEELSVIGTTKEFGGLAEYDYDGKSLSLTMEGVSLVKTLKLFSYPTVLSSDIYGTIDFNLKDKMVFINTRLKKTQFRKNKITDMIVNATGIDVLKDVYDNSSFVGGYQNSVLHSTLIIDNGVKHLYLTNTRMDSKTNGIDSDFKLKIDGEEIYGEIYGTLKEPKFSIDVQKFIERKLSRTLGKWGGTQKREAVIKKINATKQDISKKLEELDVDAVKKKTKHLLNGFFE